MVGWFTSNEGGNAAVDESYGQADLTTEYRDENQGFVEGRHGEFPCLNEAKSLENEA